MMDTIDDKFDIISKLDELINDLNNSNSIGAGQIFKYKDKFVDIEVAKSEYWLKYESIYIIECIKDKKKHYLDSHDFTLEQIDAVETILDELLEQVD